MAGLYIGLASSVIALFVVIGLIRSVLSKEEGSDVMKRIATPMVGGMVSSVLVILVVYPAIYYIWKGWKLRENTKAAANERK